jgi:hypothetical protein
MVFKRKLFKKEHQKIMDYMLNVGSSNFIYRVGIEKFKNKTRVNGNLHNVLRELSGMTVNFEDQTVKIFDYLGYNDENVSWRFSRFAKPVLLIGMG